MYKIESIKKELDLINSGKEKAILLINYNNLGDLICDSPSLRNIRKKFSNEKIIFLVRNENCVELMNNCQYIDLAIEMPHSNDNAEKFKSFCLSLKKYDFLLSIQFVRPFKELYRTHIPYMLNIKQRVGLIQKGYKKQYLKAFTQYFELENNTTRTEESLKLLEILNIEIDNYKTECWINNKKIQHFKYKNYIIIQTCATMKARMWHKDNFIKLINKILKENKSLNILLTGSKNEHTYIQEIYNEINNKRVKVLTNINIDTLINYIKNAKLLITNDTGPFHFARAYDIKTIVLFGISPKEYLIREDTNNCYAFCGTSICPSNCIIKNMENKCTNTYKIFGDNYNCINTINVNDVFLKAMCMLEEKNEK